MKMILIRIGIALILKWLEKQDNKSPIVKKLIEANSSTAITDVFKSKDMEDAAIEIVSEAAAEPIGNIISGVFKGD